MIEKCFKEKQMKKLVIASLVLGLATPAAYASKARLIALGQDKEGSLFLSDARNIFRNASYVNNVANNAFFEFGKNGNALNLDTDTDTKAEGGAFFGGGSLVYGVYLGNENDTGVLLKSLVHPTAGAMPQSDNVLELSVAGQAGVNWGATIGWAPTKDEQGAATKENKSLYTRVGLNQGAWEAYANVSIQGESDDKINGHKYDGGGAYDIGGSYKMGMNTVYARYKTVEWDQISANVKTKGDYMEMKLGVGHDHEMSSTSRVLIELMYDAAEANIKYATNPTKGDYWHIPVVFGFEKDANSWLTLRGSISQTLIGEVKTKNVSSIANATNQAIITTRFKAPNQNNYKGSLKNTTNVNAGATLNFGKLSIDGLVGTGGNNGTATAVTSETGSLSLDRLMTRVAVNYMF